MSRTRRLLPGIAAFTLFISSGAAQVSADSALWIAGEPFVGANADTFSIQGSSGAEERNRAAAPFAGSLNSLHLIPNLQPSEGALIRACLRVNGVDTSLCTDYDSTDWPAAVGNATDSVAVYAGDLISVHFTEVNGVSSGANVRASFLFTKPEPLFEDGFETGDTTSWSTTSSRYPDTLFTGLGEERTKTRVSVNTAVIVTGEPFMFANADAFSIGGSNGAEERNRGAMTGEGALSNLYLAPNQAPVAGSSFTACVRVNGVDSSLCVNYTDGDWPGAKGNTSDTVLVDPGDLVTVHFVENNGVSSTSNVRASFECQCVAGGVTFTDEPFMFANADSYTIGGGNSGSEYIRNRAAAPRDGSISTVWVAPNLDPAPGSSFTACLAINGVDTERCVTYTDADWPGAKASATSSIQISAGDLLSIHIFESNGVSSGANVRASFNF